MSDTAGGDLAMVPDGAAADRSSAGGRTDSSAGSRTDTRTRGDTRARIQQVAVELFAEHGYEGTSLREIAERLDVTKAALYYHFKSKEDIVRSLVEDYYGQMDALIAWGRQQRRTASFRSEILSRYVGIVAEGSQVIRMLHQNQAAVNTMASAKSSGELFKERLHSLIDLLTEPDASFEERIRAAMAVGSISVGWMFFADQVPDRRELSQIVSRAALDLVEPPRPA
jgi:AcrR family transcriptional regulator